VSESEVHAMGTLNKKRRLFTALIIVAVVVLLLLSLLPLAIRMGATSWLEDHGVHQVDIENVDLNLFAGTFAIEGFSADDGLKVGRLAVDVDWWPMFDHRIFIRSVELKDVVAELHQREDGSWQLSTIQVDNVAPEVIPESEKPEETDEPWQIVLNDIGFSDVLLKASGKIDKEPFGLSLPLRSLKVSLVKSEDSGAQVLKHAMELGNMTFNGLGYAVENARLQLDNTVFVPAMGMDIAAGLKIDDMNLKAHGFTLHDSRHDVGLAAIDSIELDAVSVTGSSKATFDLLSLQGISLPASGSDSLGRIGKVDLHAANLDFAGDFRLKKIAVHDLQASLKKQKNGKILVLDRLQANAEASSRPEVAEKSSNEKPGKAELSISSDGTGDSGPEAIAMADKQPSIYIEELLISEGSTFAFRDESVFPPFVTTMQVERFSFAPLDSSGEQIGKLDALLKLGKNGSLSVKGELSPNADDLRSDLKIVLKNFDMPGLTGYVESDFGHSIKTGQFDVTSGMKIANNKIDAGNKLVIRKLAMEKSPQPGKAEKGLGMPVDMALDMLRDARGDISMDVPVSGGLDDPNINVSDVINKALISSMTSGALTYAKLVLQPYGSIITAAGFVAGLAKDAAKPKLTPIQFDERLATLRPDMSEYAVKISELMKSKAFRLQICGVATRIEGAAAPQPPAQPGKKETPKTVPPQPMSDEQLLVLAEARSDVVLKAIQDQGIAADRLFNCRPNIDEDPVKASPRVEMILD